MHTMTWFSYMPEREIWLAEESKLNFDQSFLQLNTKKKINGRSCSRFEFKYWILNTANLNSYLIYANFTLIAFLSWDNFFKDVKSILWGIRTFLTSTLVKLNVKEVNIEPTHFLTLMNNGKAFSNLDGMACSCWCTDDQFQFPTGQWQIKRYWISWDLK